MNFIKILQFSDKMCLSSSEFSAIFGVNKKNVIDLNALNLIAGGQIRALCRCKYFFDGKKHIFEYNLSGCKAVKDIVFTKQEAVIFIQSLADLLNGVRENNLCFSNFAVKPKNIYFNNNEFSFIYVPKAVVSEKITANSFITTVLEKIEDDSGLIYDYQNFICESIDDEIYRLTKQFLNRVINSSGEIAQRMCTNNYSMDSESDTVPIGFKDVLEFSECDTSLLKNDKSPINNCQEYDASSQSEDETVLLGKSTADNVSEAETSLLSEENNYTDSESETVLLNQVQRQTKSIEAVLIRNFNGEMYKIAQSGTDIGTMDSMDSYESIVIKNSSISRCHASFAITDDGVYITDNNSTNGTFVEGIRISPGIKTQLFDGSLITLGNENFQIFIK